MGFDIPPVVKHRFAFFAPSRDAHAVLVKGVHENQLSCRIEISFGYLIVIDALMGPAPNWPLMKSSN